jgi:O-antigen/teichoic acid export membrane protein
MKDKDHSIPVAPKNWWLLLQAGSLLTAANFTASLGQYLFQVMMGRMLPLPEFGFLNSTLGLVLLMGIPLAATSQAIVYYLAHHHARDNRAELAAWEESSQRLLRRLTWWISVAAVLLIWPLTDFFNFPRHSLMLLALACIPINLWSVLGNAWCAGYSRFHLLSVLIFGGVVVRLATGYLGVLVRPLAEAGVAATFCSAWVLAGVFLFRPRAQVPPSAKTPWNRDFFIYLTASFFVCLSNFVFLQADQLIAQRHLGGNQLGLYTTAGLLGRAIVWGSIPFLTVFFTKRSGQRRTERPLMNLLLVYLGLLVTGATLVVLLREPLVHLFLDRSEPQVMKLVEHFAIAMLPVGILQAMGFYYLSAARLPECFVYGLCGLLQALLLILYGKTADMLVALIFGGSLITVLLMGCITLVRWSRRQP